MRGQGEHRRHRMALIRGIRRNTESTEPGDRGRSDAQWVQVSSFPAVAPVQGPPQNPVAFPCLASSFKNFYPETRFAFQPLLLA